MAKLHDQRRLTCNSHYLIFRTTSDELMAYLNISWQRCSVKPCCASELDLNGINTRNEARLNAPGIFTSMEFFNASVDTLKKQVFQSILGYYWYLRLRGHEIDQVDFARKSFGNTYALGKQTDEPRELARLLMKLCEKTGRRLRKAGYTAQGVSVACVYGFFLLAHQAEG